MRNNLFSTSAAICVFQFALTNLALGDLGPAPVANPDVQSVSWALTSGFDMFASLPATDTVKVTGSSVTSQVGVNRTFGAIGTVFALSTNAYPAGVVNILDTRSGAGAAWQWTKLVQDWPGGRGTIVANQGAGNSVGSQWGYASPMWTEGSRMGSYKWVPLAADAAASGPLSPSGPDLRFDNGAPYISGTTVPTIYGNAALWENSYTYISQADQSWPNEQVLNALYMPRALARMGNVRIYFARNGSLEGPISPFDNFTVPGGICNNPYGGFDGSSCAMVAYDYMVIVWNIFGTDVGIAMPSLPNGSRIGLEKDVYCDDKNNDDCGSIYIWANAQGSGGPVHSPIGSQRTFTQRYYVGTLPQLRALGYSLPCSQIFNVGGGVYFESTNNHYCWYPDPSYLRAFTGGSIGEHLNQIPPEAIYDGACGPSNQTFNVEGKIFYANSSKHFCWITEPALYADYVSAGGARYINLDHAPPDAQYDGPCQ